MTYTLIQMTSHALSDFAHPLAQFALVSEVRARRLVVFIHGWRGKAKETWGDFGVRPPSDQWWSESDLLFVQYDSVKERVTSVADRLRQHIGDFYPTPSAEMLVREGAKARDDISTPYEELILVGHSLGGLVIRRAMVDALDEWRYLNLDATERPTILDGCLRLFSPASAGFEPSDWLGVLRAAPLWWIAEMFLSYGSPYKSLQPKSSLIQATRSRTEAYAEPAELRRLIAAYILWASHESVVETERYTTDALTRSAHRTTHQSVCKPNANYVIPFTFVARGDIT